MFKLKIKLLTVILISLFLIQAVSACDVNETVTIDEVASNQIIEVNESYISQEDVGSEYSQSHLQGGYDESNLLIKSYEKSFEVNIDYSQYNVTYISSIMNQTLSNDSSLNSNTYIIAPFHMDNDFFRFIEVFVCMDTDASFKSSEYYKSFDNLFEFKTFDVLTHDSLTFYNHYCHVLTHDVDENILILSDKLNTNFVFSIDYSIVGSSNKLIKSYFSNFNHSSYFFHNISTFKHLFSKYLIKIECICFFSTLNNCILKEVNYYNFIYQVIYC